MNDAPTLFVVNKYCLVHRSPGACSPVNEQPRLIVSRNQCLVYKLPPCRHCWPDIKLYERYVMHQYVGV